MDGFFRPHNYSLVRAVLGLGLACTLSVGCAKKQTSELEDVPSIDLPDSNEDGLGDGGSTPTTTLPTTGGSSPTTTLPSNGGSSPTTTLPSSPTTTLPPPVSNGVFSAGYVPKPLSWESSSKPVRSEWSTAAYEIVANHFAALDKATDIGKFCSNYSTLSRDQRINTWAAIFSATAYYECGWDPTLAYVDVGTQNDRDTWSVGLLQMSVIDQQSYNMPMGLDYEDLQKPRENMMLGIAIMARQITKYGTILMPSTKGLYWATLYPGGRYDASVNIIKMVKQKMTFCQ